MKPPWILADLGSTFTKVCLVDGGSAKVLATSMSPTTVADDVNRGLDEALRLAGAPVAGPSQPIMVCSSAAGGLRIAAVGLVPELTLQAARLAALGAGGKVIRAYAWRLNSEDLDELESLRPDLILLAGGTDGGDRQYLLHNAKMLSNRARNAALIVAGNRDARDELRGILAGRTEVSFIANVMPELHRLNLDPARARIREVFLDRIVVAKGLDRLKNRARVLMPTPVAVLQAVSLLSRGCGSEPGWGELMAVDMGGATTDVYSCASGAPRGDRVALHGLPEPFEKRTVEADIGMRYTLPHLVEAVHLSAVASRTQLSPAELQAMVAELHAHPERVPGTEKECALETALAAEGIRIAVSRHCGMMEERFTAEGKVHVQEGKDLTGVRKIIGSGGPLVYSKSPTPLLRAVLRTGGEPSLKPEHPEFWLDRRYCLWAAGLLSQRDEDCAFRLLQHSLEKIEAG